MNQRRTYSASPRSAPLSRRRVLLGGLGLLTTGALAACSQGGGASAPSSSVGPVPTASPSPGQNVVTATLNPRVTTVDLGGVTVDTWAYDGQLPGKVLRATAGDFLRVTADNSLPDPTTVHWHGIGLRNAADGVPGVTQDAIQPDGQFVYEFTAPDPGTYFFHSHVGLQLDRGLYAPLILDDPQEPGDYDDEWVVVLDDWIDGTGKTPDDVFAELTGSDSATSSDAASGGAMDGMGGMDGMDGMDHGSMMGGSGASTASPGSSMSMGSGMSMGEQPWGDGGDVAYPYFLINGKNTQDPVTLTGKPGQRVRIRVINAASDTIFSVALGGHRMTVTHADGHPVQPQEVGAFWIGMGERFDVVVTLDDGAFPLVAAPFMKDGTALGVVRTGSGDAPSADSHPSELDGPILMATDLQPAEQSRLSERNVENTASIELQGQMQPYQWAINGAPYGQNDPIQVAADARLELTVTNLSMMTHPFHLHGTPFALADSGLRKDTLLLRHMESRKLLVDPEAGKWMAHCHNIYHGEAGMMIVMDAQ